MKQCVICGEDCSNRPRTKDRQGRYYCQTCHDEALARKEKVHHATTLMEMPEEPSVLDDILDVGAAASAPAAPSGGGTDSMGLEPAAPKAPPMILTQPPRNAKPEVGRTWSLVVGILAVLWGLLESGLFAISLLGTLAMAEGGDSGGKAFVLGQQVGNGLGLLLGLSLLFGGVAVLLRRPVGPSLIRIWAWFRIFLMAIAAMIVIGRIVRGAGTAESGAGALLVVILIIFCIPCFTAVFLMKTRGFQREVDSW